MKGSSNNTHEARTTRRHGFHLLVLRCAVFVSICLILIGIAQQSFSSGLICYGLNTDFGVVQPGIALTQKIYMVNFLPSEVTILQEPTCGCQLTKETVMVLPPLSVRTLTVSYRVGSADEGPRQRTTLLYTQRGPDAHRISGIVKFITRKAIKVANNNGSVV